MDRWSAEMSYYVWSILTLGFVTAIKQAIRKAILEADEERRRRMPPLPSPEPVRTEPPLPEGKATLHWPD